MNDTRFFKRECFLIDFKSFENLMQELSDYLGKKIIDCFPMMDAEQIYFISDK